MDDDQTNARPITPLDKARWCYEVLRAGLGTPAEHVAYIRKQLAIADVNVELLDESGQKTRQAIELELDCMAKGPRDRDYGRGR